MGGQMFRKILSVLFVMFMFLPMARGAEMVNVEYIHQYLNTRWGIDLPYSPELTNPRVAANMKYLLTVVDIANEFLNDEQTTDYGNGEYATLAAADTIATNTAIDTLVKAPTFTITTTPDTSSFSMIIGAAGNFIIDWGDGKRDVIADKPVGATTYSHKYTASGEYEINLTGRATDYSDAVIDPDTGAGLVPAFALTDMISGSFMATNVAKISGGLGRVFPTMDDGSNPNFYGAFALAPITEIPADLFDGIHGAPAEYMFIGTFMSTQITEVPAYLFGNLTGDGAMGMFSSTFSDCANLTTIEGPLFSGTLTLFGTLNGDGAPSMFERTFYNCKNLTTADGPLFSGTITPAYNMFYRTFFDSSLTEIPADLFAGIRGAPAESMFDYTFYSTKLTEIPADLFAGIQGAPAERMFSSTFYNTAISSVPANLFAGIRGAPADYMFSSTFSNTAISSVPANLFAGIRGAPADYMFSSTFSNTDITSVPANLFGELNGDGAMGMFSSTFNNCANLTTIEGTPAERMFSYTFNNTALTEIPADLFAGVQGAPAERMFDSTFRMCDQLQSIPENLFAGISGPAADDMFNQTFAFCYSLTGPSARINGQYLYEIWPDVINDMNTYASSRHLDDYDQIPDNWK